MQKRQWEDGARMLAEEIREWESKRGQLPDEMIDGAKLALIAHARRIAASNLVRSSRFDEKRFFEIVGVPRS